MQSSMQESEQRYDLGETPSRINSRETSARKTVNAVPKRDTSLTSNTNESADMCTSSAEGTAISQM